MKYIYIRIDPFDRIRVHAHFSERPVGARYNNVIGSMSIPGEKVSIPAEGDEGAIVGVVHLYSRMSLHGLYAVQAALRAFPDSEVKYNALLEPEITMSIVLPLDLTDLEDIRQKAWLLAALLDSMWPLAEIGVYRDGEISLMPS